MEELMFGKYLMNPEQVQLALDLLDQHCLNFKFEALFHMFEEILGINNGEGFPITSVLIDGLICRARINDTGFQFTSSVSEIGAKLNNITQGRANAVGYPIFTRLIERKRQRLKFYKVENRVNMKLR